MTIDVRQSVHPQHYRRMDTEELREHFFVEKIFNPGNLTLTYSLFDRIIFGGIVPLAKPLALESSRALGTKFFLERREIGMINLGGAGTVAVDGKNFSLEPRDGLFIGMGSREVVFSSVNPADPARIYAASTTAHRGFPTVQIKKKDVRSVPLGDPLQSNKRTIYQYVHPAVLESCQLAMGLTILEPGNVWNTMPCHTHDRRMEVYLYFDIAAEGIVFHFMGPPEETRHIIMRNDQAAISPNWSLHSGVGTTNYSFIWAMAGENQEFTDMDEVPMGSLK